MKGEIEKTLPGGWPLRRLALLVAFVAVGGALLLGAWGLWHNGSPTDNALPAAQTTANEQQDVVIPGMPDCVPCVGPTPTLTSASIAPTMTVMPFASVFGLGWF